MDNILLALQRKFSQEFDEWNKRVEKELNFLQYNLYKPNDDIEVITTKNSYKDWDND